MNFKQIERFLREIRKDKAAREYYTKKYIHKYIKKYFPKFFEKYFILNQLKKADLQSKDIIKKNIKQLLEKETLPLFGMVEIETMNKCNGTCTFCPVNKYDDPRPFEKMSEELFNKILDELAELNYTGSISIFSNNEPLMDKRIVDFCKTAYEKLPNAFHYLYTNGTLLNKDNFVELMKYLDELRIDNYNDEYVLIPSIQEVYDFYKDKDEYKDRAIVDRRLNTDIMTTRAGQANNRSCKPTLESSCVLPFYQLIIRPSGKISLCCNDSLGGMTLGDVSKQSIKEVWYSDLYKKTREDIAKSRVNNHLCKYCDHLQTELEYVEKGKEKNAKINA